MSSILTNTGAMTALQTLRQINTDLTKTQDMISTGKKVASAKDNAAIWAIAKTMEADISAYNAISDGLGSGQAMVGVARQATETISELLTEVRGKVVAADDPAADTGKIQADVDQLVGQINSIIDSAQFNGINLISNTTANQITAGIDENGVTSTIAVSGIDLSTAAGGPATLTIEDDNGGSGTFLFDGTNEDLATATIADSGQAGFAVADATAAGEKVVVTIGDQQVSYQLTQADVDAGNSEAVLATALRDRMMSLGLDLDIDYDPTQAGELQITNNTGETLDFKVQAFAAGAGGLAGLDGLAVTDATALADVDGFITAVTDAGATFGSIARRLDYQADFVSGLTDSVKSGIGALVDANMEEASARLQALQVQQQLGVQSLSIANQAPQSILALFR